MKTLKESILGNIDDTVKACDDLISGEAEFKKIKMLIASETNWKIQSNSDYINTEFEMPAPFLCRALGLSEETSIVITGAKFKYHPSFRVSIIFTDPDDKVYIKRPRINISCSARTSSGVIKTVKALFKDFNTFKLYVLKNIERPA